MIYLTKSTEEQEVYFPLAVTPTGDSYKLVLVINNPSEQQDLPISLVELKQLYGVFNVTLTSDVDNDEHTYILYCDDVVISSGIIKVNNSLIEPKEYSSDTYEYRQ